MLVELSKTEWTRKEVHQPSDAQRKLLGVILSLPWKGLRSDHRGISFHSSHTQRWGEGESSHRCQGEDIPSSQD